ncbi:MAG TPA: CDGSH iron-sulfur domain-containing protein [Caulobacteraceae bacterium]|jgi:mannose-6-phosphate isomerase-like protein (cupin superfamily)
MTDALPTEPLEPPVRASRKPYYVELQKGRPYRWCACGRSKKQPFCDNSHVGTGYEPVLYVGQYDGEEVLFCGCKHTRDAPFCDGTHANLEGGYELDDPASAANAIIREVATGTDARAILDNGCYVFSPERAARKTRGGLSYCPIISQAQGSVHQSQFYLEVESEPSPIIMMGDSDVILFVLNGEGCVDIAGERFDIYPTDGVYVRAGEGFQLCSGYGLPLTVLAAGLPAVAALSFPDAWPKPFDTSEPERVVRVDAEQRRAMGERWFQMLVDKAVGSVTAAQFIGHIPLSKAEPHRHLYEESIICLAGQGMMWTETKKARVKAGDIIFLPRKQLHSLECTAESGMEVVGVIHPGDNPGINY